MHRITTSLTKRAGRRYSVANGRPSGMRRARSRDQIPRPGTGVADPIAQLAELLPALTLLLEQDVVARVRQSGEPPSVEGIGQLVQLASVRAGDPRQLRSIRLPGRP